MMSWGAERLLLCLAVLSHLSLLCFCVSGFPICPVYSLFTFDQQEMQDGAVPITAEEEAALDLDLDEDNVQTPPAGQAHSNGGVVVNGTDVYM